MVAAQLPLLASRSSHLSCCQRGRFCDPRCEGVCGYVAGAVSVAMIVAMMDVGFGVASHYGLLDSERVRVNRRVRVESSGWLMCLLTCDHDWRGLLDLNTGTGAASARVKENGTHPPMPTQTSRSTSGRLAHKSQGYVTWDRTHGGAGSMMHSPLLFPNEHSIASYLGCLRALEPVGIPTVSRHGVTLFRSSQKSSVTGDSTIP